MGIVLCLILAACRGPALDTPTNLKVDETKLLLKWDAVENASYYEVDFGDSEEETETTSISLAALSEGTYEIRVRAVSDSKEFRNSAWSEKVEYYREHETGLVYKPINSGKEYEVSGIGVATGVIETGDTYRGKPVTQIGASAFYNSNRITGIVLGANVRTIGKRAFYNCSYLASIEMSEALTSIGEYAFQSCRSLKEITISGSVKNVSEYAFSYCRSLETLTVEEGVVSIGAYAFSNCSELKGVSLPSTIVTVDNYAFTDCTKLASASLGGTKNLGSNAFYNCKELVSLDLGSLNNIGGYAFGGCSSLTSVELPASVTTLSNNAFRGCTALETVTGGSGLQKVGRYTFRNTKLYEDSTNLVYVGGWVVDCKTKDGFSVRLELNGTVGISDYGLIELKNVSSIVLPDLSYIGDYAFYNCQELQSVTVGNVTSGSTQVRTIGEHAFDGCILLNDVILEEGVEVIGSYAFQDCQRLTQIEIPDSVNVIGTYAFYRSGLWVNATEIVYAGEYSGNNGAVRGNKWVVGFKAPGSTIKIEEGTVGVANYAFYKCDVYPTVVFPDSVKYIGKGAFYESTVMYVTLPKGLERIEDYTFYRANYLQEIELPNTVTSIGRSAFYEVFGLSEITFPASLKEIGPYAFYNCGLYIDTSELGGLVTVNFAEGGSVRIGDRAFAYCFQLTSLNLDGVQEIGARAFQECIALESIHFGSTLTEVGNYAFYSCTKLTSLAFPANIAKIGDYAFYKCTGLAQIDFGSGVKEIGASAFYGCTALTTLNIPDNVESIGKYAFRGCTSLKNVILRAGVKTVADHAFYGCSTLTVYCEAEALPEGFSARWNSSYRPVAWGTTLSVDGSIYSFVKTTNYNAVNGFSDPVRAGYLFSGWALSPNGRAMYTSENINEAENGTTLYAVWMMVIE